MQAVSSSECWSTGWGWLLFCSVYADFLCDWSQLLFSNSFSNSFFFCGPSHYQCRKVNRKWQWLLKLLVSEPLNGLCTIDTAKYSVITTKECIPSHELSFLVIGFHVLALPLSVHLVSSWVFPHSLAIFSHISLHVSCFFSSLINMTASCTSLSRTIHCVVAGHWNKNKRALTSACHLFSVTMHSSIRV